MGVSIWNFSIYEDTFLTIYCSIIIGVLGAVMGSFLHCVAWRIVSGESFSKGRSHCPQCGHVLGPFDLIPVFSWIFLGGKCRYCKHTIPARYVISEIFLAAMSVLCLLRYDLTPVFLGYLVFGGCLFTLSLVDLDSYIIPDLCLIVTVIVWLVLLPFQGWDMKEIGLHLLSALVFGGGFLLLAIVFDGIFHKESLGGGDIKLFGVVGLYLGFLATLFTVFFACIFGLILAFWKQKGSPEKGMRIPFGPAIALATWMMLLYGSGFVNWYLAFFGI